MVGLALLYNVEHGDVTILANEFLISSDEHTRAPHEYKFRHIGANIDSFWYSFSHAQSETGEC